MMEPKISIIIPVYNAEKFLKKCLNSIVKQTYSNIQIISVDDESSDQSLEILQEYAQKDKRFQIISKKNEGVSFARNIAIDYATGEYILFVDGDDWIDECTCEVAIECALQNDADMVMWSYVRELQDQSRKKIIFEDDVVFDEKAVRNKLHRRMIGLYGEELSKPENGDALCTVWGKLYRKSIVDRYNIRFFDIRQIGTYEDGLFNLDYFYYAKKVIFLNQYFYHYRKTNQASLTSRYNPNMEKQWLQLFSVMEDYIRNNSLDESYQLALENRISLSLIALGINIVSNSCTVNQKIKAIENIIKQEYYKKAIATLDRKQLPRHWKLFFYVVKRANAVGVYLLLAVIQIIRGR